MSDTRGIIHLLGRMLVITVAFALLFFIAELATALVFQNSVHPDYWTITVYDIVAAVLIVIAYIAVVIRVVYKFLRTHGRPSSPLAR